MELKAPLKVVDKMWISPKDIVDNIRKEWGPEDEEPEQPEAA